MNKKMFIFTAAAMAVVISFSACGKKKLGDTSSSAASSMPQSSAPISSEPASNLPSSDISSVPKSEEVAAPIVAMPIELDGFFIENIADLENVKKGWGQGHNVDENNRPITCNQYQPKYEQYGGLFIMPSDEKKMYLTFDEGYENGYTPVILDALKEKECPAVFFVTMDYAKKNPDLIKRIIDEGHVLGNHSVHHKSMPTLSVEEQMKEIAELHNYIVENYDYQMTLYRPPMGEWSTQSLEIARQLGYKSVLWSYAYLDYDVKKQMGVDKAFPKVTKAAHNGAIYLLHAVSKDNSEMMGDLIDNFRGQGYSLEKLG